MRKVTKKILWTTTAIATAAVIGCAAVKQIGNSVGGTYGQLLAGAATAGEAATIDKVSADRYGRSMAIQITNEYPVSSNQQMELYVNYIGHTLAEASPRPGDNYIFGVLDTDDVGAYSGPNGYIFITRGAIMKAQDEAEVAGILAHEMTHVIKEHGLAAVREAMIKSGGLQMATAAAGIQQAMPALDALGDVITKNGYDKPQEFEADQGAVQLLIAAGYDPHSFLNFLTRMQQEQSANPGGKIMSTHPGTVERIGKVQQEIASSGAAGGATNKDRFQATVHPGVAMVY
jgi:predicted Zn-dependent protease